jgi:hypothetical protein
MPTPQTDILDNFHSQFQTSVAFPVGLEDQFFLNALGDFELDLYAVAYNTTSLEIEEDLNRSEINLLGKLMYKWYLQREKDRILKLNNIIGRDIKMTAMGESKQTINKAYEKTLEEINDMTNKIKNNSFYE